MFSFENFIKGSLTSVLGLLMLGFASYGWYTDHLDNYEGMGFGIASFALLFMRDKLPEFIGKFFNAVIEKFFGGGKPPVAMILVLMAIGVSSFGQDSDATLSSFSTTNVLRKTYTPTIANTFNQMLIASKPSLLGSYANPTWISSLNYTKITGLSGSNGITFSGGIYSLGGALTSNTTISGSSFNLSLTNNAWTFGTRTGGTVGSPSLSVGVNNLASGQYSFAQGQIVTASGFWAFGGGTQSTASGLACIAYGSEATASGVYSQAFGDKTLASNSATYASGEGFFSKPITSSGVVAFNHSKNTTLQTTGHGALAAYSAILGGTNHNIPSTSISSVIIGGDEIKVSASVLNTVHLPKVRIGLGNSATLTTNNANTDVLTRNTTTGEIEIRASSSLGGGGGITNTAANNEIPKSDGTNIVPSGIESTTHGNLNLGLAATAGPIRSITVNGSSSNIDLTLTSKSNGSVQIANSTNILELSSSYQTRFGASNYDIGTSSFTPGVQRIFNAMGTSPNISFYFNAKGTTGQVVHTVNGVTQTIYSPSSETLAIQSSGNFNLNAYSSTSNISPNGYNFNIFGGSAYTASGDGNGGNVSIESGQRRIAGIGIDGNINLNCNSGFISLTQSLANDDALTQILVRDPATGYLKYRSAASLGGGGGVTSVSSGNLSPLFTANVATPTTTPALSFTAVNQTANLVYVSPASGGAAAPTFRSLVNTDIANALGGARTVTGSGGSTSQTDNLTLIYFNSASNITFTINQLTPGSRIEMINKGVGIVTFLNGSGVTFSGASTLLFDESASLIYETATVPLIRTGGSIPFADATNAGITKLYTSTGSSTDGTMDRNSITNALALKQNALTVLANATNANFTATVNSIIKLPNAILSADRTITMPAGASGNTIEIYNRETAFNWNLAGSPIYLSDETTVVTSLFANTYYSIIFLDGKWQVKN